MLSRRCRAHQPHALADPSSSLASLEQQSPGEADEDEVDPDAVLDPDEAELSSRQASEAELELAASVMQRLLSLVSELPQDQYTGARQRIVKVHEVVES